MIGSLGQVVSAAFQGELVNRPSVVPDGVATRSERLTINVVLVLQVPPIVRIVVGRVLVLCFGTNDDSRNLWPSVGFTTLLKVEKAVNEEKEGGGREAQNDPPMIDQPTILLVRDSESVEFVIRVAEVRPIRAVRPDMSPGWRGALRSRSPSVGGFLRSAPATHNHTSNRTALVASWFWPRRHVAKDRFVGGEIGWERKRHDSDHMVLRMGAHIFRCKTGQTFGGRHSGSSTIWAS